MNQPMPETQHTPGPWEIREIAHEATPWSPRRVYRVEINAPQYLHGRRTHSRYIANIVDYVEWTDQPANARLIAAAPDLLEVARMAALDTYPRGHRARMNAAARSAISKATGAAQ